MKTGLSVPVFQKSHQRTQIGVFRLPFVSSDSVATLVERPALKPGIACSSPTEGDLQLFSSDQKTFDLHSGKGRTFF